MSVEAKMECSHCGKHLPEDADFCMRCGKPLTDNARSQQGATTESMSQIRDAVKFGVGLLMRDEYEDWLRRYPENFCPLCQWRIFQYVLFEGQYWLWIAAKSPYWKYHTIFIPKEHIRSLDQITVPAMGELIEIYKRAVEMIRAEMPKMEAEGASDLLFFWRLRSGESARIEHFHMHLTPDPQKRLESIFDPKASEWNPEAFIIEQKMT
jgi:diadenosine tetraphosphate (Ap4A) HIT family hydrolase